MNFEEKRCPHCGALLVENASFCPYCESVLIEKRPAEMPKPKRRRRITAALLLAAILVVTLTAVGFANRGKIIDAQGAELTYETDGQTFHLALSFESQGGAPFFGQPLFTVEVREDQVRGQVSSSRVFVDNGGGVDKKNEFLALVDHYEVTTTPCDGITLLQIDETCIPTTSNAAIEAIPSYHTEQLKEGEGNVIWTIYLKNGDTLRLRHTVKITRVPVVTLTENDYPMATVDDLNVLLDTLAHEADRKSVYILQLPAVTYEGGLTMKNFCCDLVGSEGGTTFTGTVTVATRGIHPSNITNVRFVGDGTGIGLSASEGAFLHRCTFENWEIGAYGGLGSWVNATGCTFRGNGVGLWLDNRGGATCSGSYYGDSVYEDNGIAVRIAAMPGTETLDFNNCVFRGNGVNVENTAGYAADLSQIVTADN